MNCQGSMNFVSQDVVSSTGNQFLENHVQLNDARRLRISSLLLITRKPMLLITTESTLCVQDRRCGVVNNFYQNFELA